MFVRLADSKGRNSKRLKRGEKDNVVATEALLGGRTQKRLYREDADPEHGTWIISVGIVSRIRDRRSRQEAPRSDRSLKIFKRTSDKLSNYEPR